MPIPVICECGRQLMAKDEYAGRQTQCPDCGRDLIIPEANLEPAGYAPPPSPTPSADPFAVQTDWAPGPEKFGPPRTSGKAIASLVTGLLSFVCCLSGIPAIILGFLSLSEIDKSQGRVQGKGMAIAGLVTGFIGTILVGLGVLIALLLPAVQAAREAARRTQCISNLKKVGLAMHNFHDTQGHFPPQAITDEVGNPLLSWRVAILPFIERSDLYNRFHLDEPWDSPHNLSLLQEMPLIYACPSDSLQSLNSGLTSLQVLAGPGTLFEPGREGVKLREILDGTSNTLMVVESTDLVEWTRPDDLDFVPRAFVAMPPDLGSNHPGGYNVLMADGSVRFIKYSINPQTFQALSTRDGGEVISSFDF
ncbi:hypothetical protein BH23PLA1_BH23PLA1_15030 [soil metagenome]